MARRRTSNSGATGFVLMALGLVAYGLYAITREYFGVVILLAVILGLGWLVYWLVTLKTPEQEAAERQREQVLSNRFRSEAGRAPTDQEMAGLKFLQSHSYNPRKPHGSMDDIAAAVHHGDWLTAWRWLQRIGYVMVRPGVSQAEKDRFRSLMTTFASGDPNYRALLNRVLPVIEAQPGVMQSQFTKGLAGEQVEMVRYMFYFAHELGDLMRVKKGNSYQLYPPGYEIAPATISPAKKRARKKKPAAIPLPN